MKINELNNLSDLAFYLNVDRSLLQRVLFKIPDDDLYTEFTINKKDNSTRIIHSPCKDLKIVQKSLLDRLTDDLKESRKAGISHAFTSERNICTNAKWHRNKRLVISFDIKDFFPSINFGRVLGFLEKDHCFQLKKPLSVQVANLLCYRNVLPQGAPTSPLISNLICGVLDYRLLSIAKRFRMSCTRYADDITFSTNASYSEEEIKDFIKIIYNEISRAGFIPNVNKTRIYHRNQRQVVTGICINKRLNVTRDYYKTTRAMAYSLYKNGHYKLNGYRGKQNNLEGRFQHIYSVDNHICFAEEKKYNSNESPIFDANNWNSHFVDYARFLTYRSLWKNTRIMMFCEGKTDPIYIKSALKALAIQYPQLVSSHGKQHKFKIQFFNHHSKINDVIGFNGEGGNQLINLLYFYNIKSKKEYHQKRSTILPWIKKICPIYESPVIILVDNEKSSNSPLKALYNACKNELFDKDFKNLDDSELIAKLRVRPYIHIVDNLYLLTYQRINDEDTEIEDILDNEYITKRLSPRKLDKTGTKHKSDGYYSKDFLSSFVSKHYKDMDFNNFKFLFDSIIQICKENDIRRNNIKTE